MSPEHSRTLVLCELRELALGPFAGLGIGGVPEGVVRVVLKGNAGSWRPLGMLLTKTLQLGGGAISFRIQMTLSTELEKDL